EAEPAFGPDAADEAPGAGAAAGAPAAPGTVAAPPPRVGRSEPALTTYLAGVAVVLLLLAGRVGLAQTWGRRRGLTASSAIRLLGQRNVGPGASVCLVEVGARILRLGLHREGMVFLGEVADAAEVAALRAQCRAAAAGPDSFGSVLRDAVRAFEGAPAHEQRRSETLEALRAEIGRIHGVVGSLRESLGSAPEEPAAPETAPAEAPARGAAAPEPPFASEPELEPVAPLLGGGRWS
ncbi:MAG: flagellar biosynthetic protein FliO, partial [Planctomycetes bacterium]|nr:flagellar biosynthetic protein FliO [Planctomycetota bacterium]